MGRFHRHDDDHTHEHEHDHGHDHGHEQHHHLPPAGPVHVYVHGSAPVELHVHFDQPHHHHDHGHGHHDHHHDHQHEHEHSHDSQAPELAEKYGDHSGYDTGRERLAVLEDIFTENDACAAQNQQLFAAHGIRCVNLMSSPGAGKTTLLTKTLTALQGKVRVGIVEGDIETGLDAERLEGLGAQVSLLNTGNGFGGECHLDAPMVAQALKALDLSQLDLVLIENVGNLVCPAEFEVGETAKAMVFSVTEGEDKPLKYPVMFAAVSALVINKIDLLPHLDFDLDLFLANFRQVNPTAQIFQVSATTGAGLADWVAWLTQQLAS